MEHADPGVDVGIPDIGVVYLRIITCVSVFLLGLDVKELLKGD